MRKFICLVILLCLPGLFGFSPGCGEVPSITTNNYSYELYSNAKNCDIEYQDPFGVRHQITITSFPWKWSFPAQNPCSLYLHAYNFSSDAPNYEVQAFIFKGEDQIKDDLCSKDNSGECDILLVN
jgi:hypothetical protein